MQAKKLSVKLVEELDTDTKVTGGIGKAIGRMFSGESFFMIHCTAKGRAEIGFASSFRFT